MTSLIFKFRNDFSLVGLEAWYRFYEVSHEYVGEARLFFRDTYRLTEYLDPTADFQLLCDRLQEFFGDQLMPKPIRFLFEEEEVTINQLSSRIKDYPAGLEYSSLGPDWIMPNLFNYFRIDFPETTPEEKIQTLINTLGDFLPANADDTTYLLQYAYLKGEPVALSGLNYNSASAAHANANQAYFDDMRIADAFSDSLTAGITIVEKHSWYLKHPQLPTLPSLRPKIVYPKGQVYTDVIEKIKPPVGCIHGTQILGILIANPNDDDDNIPATQTDFCRGIIPNAQVRLVSCLAKGTTIDTATGQFGTCCYAEELAILAAISVTATGETILIELATGSGLFPLDVLPAVYELIDIAYRLHITVIAGAGNGDALGKGAILDTVSAKRPLMPRDLRMSAAINSQDSDDDDKPTHWQVYEQWDHIKERYQLGGNSTSFTSVDDFLNHYQQTPSKAILVGAVLREDGPQFTLKKSSSRGDRVNVFAQGNDILTITPAEGFAGDMGDTSGAAAIIAGIAVLAQGVAKAQRKVIPPDILFGWLKYPSGISLDGFPAGLSGVVPFCEIIRDKLNGWLSAAS